MSRLQHVARGHSPPEHLAETALHLHCSPLIVRRIPSCWDKAGRSCHRPRIPGSIGQIGCEDLALITSDQHIVGRRALREDRNLTLNLRDAAVGPTCPSGILEHLLLNKSRTEALARASQGITVQFVIVMRVTLPQGDSRHLKALTLVIDNNPVPVAAIFTFGDTAGVSVISTRVRVNSYTDVHVVAELSDSKLYVAKTFVKASGGCSAPAAKNADEAIASLGKMKFRVFGKTSGAQGEAQIMDFHQDRLMGGAGDSGIRSGRLEITRAIRCASSRVNPSEWFLVP